MWQKLDVYRDAADAIGRTYPALAMRSSTLIDGVSWGASDPL